MAYNSLVVLDTLKVTAGKSYTNNKRQILMAKTHGFHKVVRASAVTPRKRRISKVVTIPVADSGIIRPIIVLSEALPHKKALTSEHTY
jgi:hypothetical protein